jgi:uncharacterized membrane protein
MKNLIKTHRISTVMFAMVVLFSSCAKRSYETIISTSMVHEQTLAKPNLSTVQTLVKVNEIACQTPTTVKIPDKAGKVTPKERLVALKNLHKKLTETISSKTEHFIAKQTAVIRSQTSNHHTASVGDTHKTQSWLGAAILFLILGLVFAFLGFTSLGSLFWAIGVVLFVVAVVFFILWLLADAAV